MSEINSVCKEDWWDWDSIVGLATFYELDGRESNSGGGRFSAPFQSGPADHPASYTMGTGFAGCKAAGAWRWPPTPSRAGVKER